MLTEAFGEAKGTADIGTVKGDRHNINKNLVIMMMEGAGFKVVDLGVNADVAVFVKALRGRSAPASWVCRRSSRARYQCGLPYY